MAKEVKINLSVDSDTSGVEKLESSLRGGMQQLDTFADQVTAAFQKTSTSVNSFASEAKTAFESLDSFADQVAAAFQKTASGSQNAAAGAKEVSYETQSAFTAIDTFYDKMAQSWAKTTQQQKTAAAVMTSATSTAKQEAKALQRAWGALGATSLETMKNQAKAATQAYLEIKKQGASVQELAVAKAALKKTLQQVTAQYRTLGATGSKQMGAISGATNSAVISMKSLLQTMAAGVGIYQLTNLIRNSITALASYQDALAMAQYRLKASDAEMKKVAATAKELAFQYRGTATEILGAFEELGLAGLNVNESLKAVNATLLLATTQQISNAEAAGMLTDIMKNQKLTLDDTVQTVETLAAATITTNSKFGELFETFTQVGAQAAAIHEDFTDLTAAMALMHDAGIKGSEAGTALNNVFLRLLDPSTENAEAQNTFAEALGQTSLQIKNANGDFIGFETLVKQLSQAVINMGLDSVDTAALMTKAFGVRGAKALLLLSNAGADAIGKLKKDMASLEGATGRLLTKLKDNSAGILDRMKAGWELILISIGNGLLPILQDVGEWFSENRRTVEEFFSYFTSFANIAYKAIKMIWNVLQFLGESLGELLYFVDVQLIQPVKTLVKFINDCLVAWKNLFSTIIGGSEDATNAVEQLGQKSENAGKSLENLEEKSGNAAEGIKKVKSQADNATKSVGGLGKAGEEAVSNLEDAFEALGLKSSQVAQEEVAALVAANEQIQTSNDTTAQKKLEAWLTVQQKILELYAQDASAIANLTDEQLKQLDLLKLRYADLGQNITTTVQVVEQGDGSTLLTNRLNNLREPVETDVSVDQEQLEQAEETKQKLAEPVENTVQVDQTQLDQALDKKQELEKPVEMYSGSVSDSEDNGSAKVGGKINLIDDSELQKLDQVVQQRLIISQPDKTRMNIDTKQLDTAVAKKELLATDTKSKDNVDSSSLDTALEKKEILASDTQSKDSVDSTSADTALQKKELLATDTQSTDTVDSTSADTALQKKEILATDTQSKDNVDSSSLDTALQKKEILATNTESADTVDSSSLDTALQKKEILATDTQSTDTVDSSSVDTALQKKEILATDTQSKDNVDSSSLDTALQKKEILATDTASADNVDSTSADTALEKHAVLAQNIVTDNEIDQDSANESLIKHAELEKDMETDWIITQKIDGGSVASAQAGGGIAGSGLPVLLADGGFAFPRLANPLISQGSGVTDDVPALLMRDEFVLRQAAVKKYGLPLLYALNNLQAPVDLLPRFAGGGLVSMDSYFPNRRYIDVIPRFAEGGSVRAALREFYADLPRFALGGSVSGGFASKFSNYSQYASSDIERLDSAALAALVNSYVSGMTDKLEYAAMVSDPGQWLDDLKGLYAAGANELQSTGSVSGTLDSLDGYLEQMKALVRAQYQEEIAYERISADSGIDSIWEELLLTLEELIEETKEALEELAEEYTEASEEAYQEWQEAIADESADYHESYAELQAAYKAAAERVRMGYPSTYKADKADLAQAQQDMADLNAAHAKTLSGLKSGYEDEEEDLQDDLYDDSGDLYKENYREGRRYKLEQLAELTDLAQDARHEIRLLEIAMARELLELEQEYATGTISASSGYVSGYRFGGPVRPVFRSPVPRMLHFDQGGLVPLFPGSTPGVDSVPAWLAPEEYVLTPPMVDTLGLEFLEQLRGATGLGAAGLGSARPWIPAGPNLDALPKLPKRFAEGGLVGAAGLSVSGGSSGGGAVIEENLTLQLIGPGGSSTPKIKIDKRKTLNDVMTVLQEAGLRVR